MTIDSSIIEIISTLGFPIFIAVWLLLRTEKIIAANTQAINNNTSMIIKYFNK